MTEPTAFEEAAKRLNDALDALDAAVERRLDLDCSAAALSEQVHTLAVDRSKLAADLDVQIARAHRLEIANRDAGRRIDAAMQNIQFVLESKD